MLAGFGGLGAHRRRPAAGSTWGSSGAASIFSHFWFGHYPFFPLIFFLFRVLLNIVFGHYPCYYVQVVCTFYCFLFDGITFICGPQRALILPVMLYHYLFGYMDSGAAHSVVDMTVGGSARVGPPCTTSRACR